MIEQIFEYRSVEKRKLIWSLSITVVVMLIELMGGMIVNSLALVSDAGHMFTHAFAIGISLAAIYIACNPPCHHRTFGLFRAEILAAFINGLFLVFVVGLIIYESVLRIIHPQEVLGFHMLIVALIGLFANLASILILRDSHHNVNINIRGVFLHMIADAISSVGIIIAAVIISFTGWNIIDPIVSLGISAIIIFWAIGILKDSTRVLLEIAPEGLDTHMVTDDLSRNFVEIKGLYNVHLWTITPDMLVFSAHANLKPVANQNESIRKINKYLAEKYKVIESTIQVISDEEAEVCNVLPDQILEAKINCS